VAFLCNSKILSTLRDSGERSSHFQLFLESLKEHLHRDHLLRSQSTVGLLLVVVLTEWEIILKLSQLSVVENYPVGGGSGNIVISMFLTERQGTEVLPIRHIFMSVRKGASRDHDSPNDSGNLPQEHRIRNYLENETG
jgi:hypothetical protein